MTDRKFSRKKALILFGCVAAIALWMYFEITRWNSGGRRYFGSADIIYNWFGINKHSGMGDKLVLILYYCTSGLFSVVLYMFITLIPERTDILKTVDGRKKIFAAAVTVLTVTGINMLLSQSGIYELLIPKAGVVGSVQNKIYALLPAFNVVLAPIAVLACFAFVEIPSAVKNKDRIFRPNAIKASAARYLLCVAIPVVGSVMIAGLLAILKKFNPSAVTVLESSGGFGSTDTVLIIKGLVCAPIFEEIAFHGMMFGKMKKHIPTWLALVISSVLFGIWHRNLGQFVYTVVIGFICAASYHYTNRLRYPIFIHFVNNYISNIALATAGKGVILDIPILREMRKSLVAMEIVPAIIVCLISASIIIALLMLLRKVGEPYSELKLKKEQTA